MLHCACRLNQLTAGNRHFQGKVVLSNSFAVFSDQEGVVSFKTNFDAVIKLINFLCVNNPVIRERMKLRDSNFILIVTLFLFHLNKCIDGRYHEKSQKCCKKNIPPTTAIPIETRLCAPSPKPRANGDIPSIVARLVIRMV